MRKDGIRVFNKKQCWSPSRIGCVVDGSPQKDDYPFHQVSMDDVIWRPRIKLLVNNTLYPSASVSIRQHPSK